MSFIYLTYRTNYANNVYEGVFVNGVEFGGENKEKVGNYFARKNKSIQKSVFTRSDSAKSMYLDNSFNQLNISGDTFGIFTLPVSGYSSSNSCSYQSWADLAGHCWGRALHRQQSNGAGVCGPKNQPSSPPPQLEHSLWRQRRR